MKQTISSLVVAIAFVATPFANAQAMPDFGSDSGDYTNDGECDDPRFEGEGMTNTPLLNADIMADASDCKKAWNAGTLQLASDPILISAPDFGDDASSYANDGECDDPRFEGDGMTSTLLLSSDRMHDATDCESAWNEGLLQFADELAPDFGDDSSLFANDGECDDPRFSGDGMTNTILLEDDHMSDATDCQAAWDAGDLQWATDTVSEPVDISAIDFGEDASFFANNGECDDPRFKGSGMTTTLLIDSDRLSDASDCLAAYENGTLELK